MSTFCAICLGPLNEPPVPGASGVVAVTPPAGAHAKICGHVFHRHCVERVIREQESVNMLGSCPLCRAVIFLDDLTNIHLDYRTPECDRCESSNDVVKSLQGALEEKDSKIKKLEAELELLKLKESKYKAGSRIHLEREFTDSKCYNCESKLHTSLWCLNPPYLRFTETTKFEKWAPIEKFSVTSKIPFESEDAGTVITYFSKKLNLRWLSRIQIQTFFGFAFFDDCCWNCASPFHHRGACPNDDMGIKAICKMLHEVNHPLTAEAAAARSYYRERAEREREELGAHQMP